MQKRTRDARLTLLMTPCRRWTLITAAVLAATGSGLGLWSWHTYTAPGPLATEQLVLIPPGSGAKTIARQLHHKGVLAHPWAFLACEALLGQTGQYQAGEYRLPPQLSPQALSQLLRSGGTVQRRVILVEGQTVAAFRILTDTLPGLAGDWPADIAEGSLQPDTYFYQWDDSKAALVARMQAARTATLTALWQQRAPDLPLHTPQEALILASIVEKETSLPAEYGRVASVFLNRLRRGMPLQSDPTVIYALSQGTGALDRLLTRADLKVEAPHNTYHISGLPPTPISNPGTGALRAVLNPPATDDLYFVANGSGGHAFARTLAGHNRNVAAWRRLRDRENSGSFSSRSSALPDGGGSGE
jgi:UPF0755 protein